MFGICFFFRSSQLGAFFRFQPLIFRGVMVVLSIFFGGKMWMFFFVWVLLFKQIKITHIRNCMVWSSDGAAALKLKYITKKCWHRRRWLIDVFSSCILIDLQKLDGLLPFLWKLIFGNGISFSGFCFVWKCWFYDVKQEPVFQCWELIPVFVLAFHDCNVGLEE